jgi:hypothetical protein
MISSRGGSRFNRRVTRFERGTFCGKERFTFIGDGSLGAKASGLARLLHLLDDKVAPHFGPISSVDVPLLTVISTDMFDQFVEQNGLNQLAETLDDDESIVQAFQKAELPAEVVQDLRAFLTHVRTPLAIRSSSLLEDSMGEPFAGVYATRMTPNNLPLLEDRLNRLMRCVKYVYASTFMRKAKDYLAAVKRSSVEEKMAVVIQEVVGVAHEKRFYPHISGVARSYNFYPLGLAQPRDGVVDLALGLGKTVVEDGIAWSYSPAYPHVSPPYNTVRDLLKLTQREFWAIDMVVHPDPPLSDRVDYLRQYELSIAEQDGVLGLLASTYRPGDDRVTIGISGDGPRILNFAPILTGDALPLTSLLQRLLNECEQALGYMVAIEFAMTLNHGRSTPAHFGFLQARPMVVSESLVEVPPDLLIADDVLVASESALGNGRVSSVRNIVYLRPEVFNVAHSRTIGQELETINRSLLAQNEPYLLIGFGRWGSSDPSAGIPVNFGQISGARVIVETTLPNINFMLSQGSHFFQNLTSFEILYFSVSHAGPHRVDWQWLGQQSPVAETQFVRHVRTASPLEIKVDGRSSRGVILKGSVPN